MGIIKKKAKAWYKKVVINFFLLVYKKPLVNSKNQNTSEKIHNLKIDGSKYNLFELTNGRIYTDTNDTTAYITENNCISGASLQYKKFDFINSKNQKINKNETIEKGTPKFKKKIKGNILSLVSGGASKDNFTHWFTDVIPRIMIYQKKFNLNNISKFYVPSIRYKFQLESLINFGINRKDIITSEKYKHIEANKIYATSHPCFHNPEKVKNWSIEYLNKIFNKSKKSNKYQKIFIDRDQLKLIDVNNLKKFAGYRVLMNENDIKKYLSSIGFLIIKPENYTFLEQIKIFSNAKYIVGLHGAAMMMLSFCKKGTKILIIKTLKCDNVFKNISKLIKSKYKEIILKPIIKSPIPQNGLLNCPIVRIKRELKFFGLKKI